MIIGESINLRFIEEKDIETYISIVNNLENLGNYFPNILNNPNKIRDEFKQNKFSTDDLEVLLIVDKSDSILGLIFHYKVDNSPTTREIAYLIADTQKRGKGITTEALNIISKYLFKTRFLNRLELWIDERNLASQKVAEKSHYVKEGIARGSRYINGEFINACIYSLLRKESDFKN